jgi:hypothetical protein
MQQGGTNGPGNSCETKAALPFALAVVAGLSLSQIAYAGEEENPEDFMQLHNIEIAFHKAGSTREIWGGCCRCSPTMRF